MGRVEDLSTGRLVELPPAVLAELARRALEQEEDASTPGP